MATQAFNSLVNGFVQGPLFNVQPFTPVAPGVPEPSSWAMMLIGFAAVGSLTYCRTKKNQKALAAA